MARNSLHTKAVDIVLHLFKLWGIDSINNKKPLNGYTVFFDVDGTLSRSNLLSLFMHTVSMRDLLPKDKLLALRRAQREYTRRRWSYTIYEKALIESYVLLKGLPRWFLEHLADLTFEEFEATYYVFTYTLLKKAKELGARLYAVTGAPELLLNRYLKQINLKVDGYFCSKLIYNETGFTGNVDVQVVLDKGRFVLEVAPEHAFDFNKAIFLGDTEGDISLMKLVRYPLAVNPNMELIEYVEHQAIPWVVERKNVILFITPKGEIIF